MALLKANGADVVEARLVFPRIGAWHADLVVDRIELDGFDHRVTLSFPDAGVSFVGSLVRGGPFADKLRIRIGAGAGKLHKTAIAAKSYQGVPLRIPLTDVLTAAGDQLAPSADQALLGTVLQKWVSVQQNAVAAVTNLLSPFGASWRFLPDGTVWVGTESWPALQPDHVLVDEQLDVGRFEIACEAPVLRPGVTFLGARVSRVEHVLDAHRFRTIAWAE